MFLVFIIICVYNYLSVVVLLFLKINSIQFNSKIQFNSIQLYYDPANSDHDKRHEPIGTVSLSPISTLRQYFLLEAKGRGIGFSKTDTCVGVCRRPAKAPSSSLFPDAEPLLFSRSVG